MKYLLLLTVILLNWNCLPNNEQKPETNISNHKVFTDINSLKIIHPLKVDLKKSQAFIDTSHSFRSQKIKNWNFVAIDNWIDKEVLKPANIDYRKDFINSSKYLSLRKLEDQFFIYNRSDGKDPLFEFNNEYFILFGIQETTVLNIDRIESMKDTIKIWTTSNVTNESSITISPTKYAFVYKIRVGSTEGYVTNHKEMYKFTSIVNFTPLGKQRELFNWDSWGSSIN